MKVVTVAFAVALVAGASGSLRAQQVFSANVERVAVDVTVVDRQGRPVTDLRAEDFVVTVGGRPRRTASAQLLRYDAIDRPPSAVPTSAARSAFAVNTAVVPGRLVVLAVDVGSLSVGGARAVSDAAIRFLDLLTPRDRVALFALPTGPSLDFTSDHGRITDALRRLRGTPPTRSGGFYHVSLAEAFARFSPMGDRRVWCAAWEREVMRLGVSGSGRESCPSDAQLDAEARRVYEGARASAATTEGALLGLVRALAPFEGPKTLVLLSQGLVTGASAGDPGRNHRLGDVADAAAAARTSVYTIHVDRHFLEAMDVEESGMAQTPGLDQHLLADGLEAIAGYTGGSLLKTTTRTDSALARVAWETAAGWLLSFEPEADDSDGKAHDIRVRVKRDGVFVRARSRFVVRPKAVAPADPGQAARRCLDAPLVQTDVPIAMSAYALEGSDDAKRLIVAAELGLAADQAEASAVGYRLLDAQGQVAAGAIETGRLETLRTSGGEALYYLVTVSLKPGAYTLKLAVAAPSGRTGSIEMAVTAQLAAAAELRLSDLLVAEPGRRATGPVLSADARLWGRSVRAMVEVCGAATPPSVQYEVSAAGEPGAALMAGAVVRPAALAGCHDAEADLDLESLAGGHYELRAVVFLPDGRVAGRVARPLWLAEKR